MGGRVAHTQPGLCGARCDVVVSADTAGVSLVSATVRQLRHQSVLFGFLWLPILAQCAELAIALQTPCAVLFTGRPCLSNAN